MSDPHSASTDRLGIVVIGRNEGERLIRCFQSLSQRQVPVVYADSGSSDGSAEAAERFGITALRLDQAVPFTAARARNEGFKRLLELQSQVEYIFFVDGDCEVCAGWLDEATAFLRSREDVATVFGLRRERFPEKSPYNLLCDIEWRNSPIGEAMSCGGDAVIRAKAFQQVGGFGAGLICGEEPDLCFRLRKAGWLIWHIDVRMTVHDAAMYRFSQWWYRMVRGGYAFAQGSSMYGSSPEKFWVGASRRAWIWGLFIPLVALLSALAHPWWALIIVGVYPLQWARLALSARKSITAKWLWAGAMVIGKFPEMLGQLKYYLDRWRKSNSRIIEYK
jgi:GT2 family glycosyltransferase